ncbi:PRC-barrel domain-containing protein [Humitalea sp. 24SJ18S-53]|uniref:PRC-barrel domain-containing protein n=1 Tax=Humitalea sp. 24SJ18S-53 TaxID=3422307 RepID=UPI003D6661DE
MSKVSTQRHPILAATLAAGLLASFGATAQPAPRDGAPGNPPSTAVGRAVDRATGSPTVPDGAPGNPPGTAVGRAVDRATGGPATPGTAEVMRTAPAGNTAVTYRPRVSQMIGSNVYNERDESIGEIEDVVLSPAGDRAMAVISVGGFLGMGARLVALPLTELGWNAQRERVTLPGATKEQLQARPVYTYEQIRRG